MRRPYRKSCKSIPQSLSTGRPRSSVAAIAHIASYANGAYVLRKKLGMFWLYSVKNWSVVWKNEESKKAFKETGLNQLKKIEIFHFPFSMLSIEYGSVNFNWIEKRLTPQSF